MPFTLAHPAAILPLRKLCPRYLSFGALVMGSMAPDAGYVFAHYGIEDYAHRFAGSFGFSLPVGLAMLAALYLFRRPLVEWLPAGQRDVFRPICRQRIPSPLILIISVLIGSWTHIVWDWFTHGHSWLVAAVPFLHAPLLVIRGHTVLVCHLLWCISSSGGVGLLCYEYEKWRAAAQPGIGAVSRSAAIRNALWVGLLVLPIGILHYMIGTVLGFAVLGASSVLLIIFVALKMGEPIPVQRPD